MQRRKAVEDTKITIDLRIGWISGDEKEYPARNMTEHNITTNVAQKILRDSRKLWGNCLILKAMTSVIANESPGIIKGTVIILFSTLEHFKYRTP